LEPLFQRGPGVAERPLVPEPTPEFGDAKTHDF
jgi:hypothetical protein